MRVIGAGLIVLLSSPALAQPVWTPGQVDGALVTLSAVHVESAARFWIAGTDGSQPFVRRFEGAMLTDETPAGVTQGSFTAFFLDPRIHRGASTQK